MSRLSNAVSTNVVRFLDQAQELLESSTFLMNSYNDFDYCKIQKKVANIIYLQKNVIFYLKVISDFLIRRLKAETSYFLMKNFWSTFSQHLLPNF